jgi:hypothetical protein
MKCPEFNDLIDFLDGRLSGDKADLVAGHLESGCRDCFANRDWYEQVRSIATGDHTVEPPPWVLKRAIRLFETRKEKPNVAARVGQAIASLVFDSISRPMPEAARSAHAANRQLLYCAGDYSIDLVIAQSGQSGADMFGQVLRDGDFEFESVKGLPLELTTKGQRVRSVETNGLGEFSMNGLMQGEYDLKVETPEASITIQNLPLKVS